MNTATPSIGSIIPLLIVIIAISVGVFLVLRAFWLWYWKIYVIIRNQETQIELMEEQNNLLRKLVQGKESN